MKKKYLYLSLVLICTWWGVRAQEVDISTLDLRTSIEIALERNLTLQRSVVNLSTAEANLLQNQGQRLPSFSTGASSGYRWGRSINPVTNLFESQRIGNINLFANSSLPLFSGNQILNSIQQSKTEIEAAKFNLAATENDITLNVINLFINIIFNKEQLKIAEYQLNTTQQQLQNTTKLVKAGSLPLGNQLDLQAQNSTNELEVINAQNNVRIAKLNLAQALQIPFDDRLDVVSPELETEDYEIGAVDVTEIFEIAVETMPEVKAAELGVESAEYGVKIAKGAFYPSLGVSANIFSNYVDRALGGEIPSFNTQIETNLSQSANLQLNIPIFSNFRNKAGLQRARLQKRLSEIQELEVKNLLRQDIETAYTEAYAAKQSYQASLTRVSSLEESFRIAQQRFDAGAINSVDFQIAQNNLFNAQADLINAKYNYIFRTKVLDFYLGNPLNL